MISRVRIEALGNSPAQLQAEIDAILHHLRMVGLYEGIVPRNSWTTEEVYPRKQGEVVFGERRFGFEFEGRKIMKFEPNEGFEVQRPLPQDEYSVQNEETGTD